MSRGSHRASVRCLRQTTASMACSCPIRLSASGKPSDPETFLQVSPNCVGDTTKRHTAHNEHPFDWSGTPTAGTVSQPGGHVGLIPSCEHDAPVDPGRLAASVDLRHPPHTQQSVRAAPEHQLLQITDLCQVPCPTRREDPLPQPPYVVLDLTPIHGVPIQNIALRSVPTTSSAAVPNLPISSGVSAHLVLTGPPDPRQLPFGPGNRPYPTSYAETSPAEAPALRFPISCCLSAVGIRFLDHPAPAGEFNLPHGRPTESPAVSGPQRDCRVAHEQDPTEQGAPLTPGTVVRSQPAVEFRPAPAASQRPVPTTPLPHPIDGADLHEASSEVHSRSPITPGQPGCRPRPGSVTVFPSVFSSPATPGWNESRFGLYPGLRTPQLPATHAEAETGHRALTQVLHLRHQPNLQTVFPTSLMHPHVAPTHTSPRAPPPVPPQPGPSPPANTPDHSRSVPFPDARRPRSSAPSW